MNDVSGHRLKRSREYLGLSIEEVASLLGISSTQLEQIESAQIEVKQSMLQQLFSMYGIVSISTPDVPSVSTDTRFLARTKKLGLTKDDLYEVNRFASYLRNSNRGRSK